MGQVEFFPIASRAKKIQTDPTAKFNDKFWVVGQVEFFRIGSRTKKIQTDPLPSFGSFSATYVAVPSRPAFVSISARPFETQGELKRCPPVP